MFKVIEVKKTIPQDFPTHWSIYKDGVDDPILTVWTKKAVADKICEFFNKNGNEES